MTGPADTARLVETIKRERDRRHWTIDQWRDEFGPNRWTQGIAATRIAADKATDALADEIKRLTGALESYKHGEETEIAWRTELQAEVERLRDAAEAVLEQDLSGETVLVSYAAYKKLDAALAGEKP